MAEIVFGAALSHSPQTCVHAELWGDLVERDRSGRKLLGVDGGLHTFEELCDLAPAQAKDVLDLVSAQKMYNRVQSSLDKIAEKIAEADPDVVLIVGDDQSELFLNDGMPTFALFWGDELTDVPRPDAEIAKMSPGLLEGYRARHSAQKASYVVASDLAKHLVVGLVERGFDISQLSKQPAGRDLGHAFTSVQERVLNKKIPMIPLFQNTYFPPNQPLPGRCYDLGVALASTIESWSGNERVAIVASGGLSHVTVDEELDRVVLKALKAHDREELARLPRNKLRFGTSEILNWVTAAGALEHLEMELIEYIAGYRSPAGTGCGMGFAIWE